MVNMKNESEKVRIFWEEFLRSTGRSETTECFEVFYFGLTEKLANELLELVLIGQKKATSSSSWTYEIKGELLPKVGDLSIVTDFEGSPKCVIETRNVPIVPFSEMTFDICKREGEDDSLESWREGHIRFFTEEGKLVGFEFREDMPVVFEDFEVIYK